MRLGHVPMIRNRRLDGADHQRRYSQVRAISRKTGRTDTIGVVANEASLDWGQRERQLLATAMNARGHTQPACIEALQHLGGPKVSQPTLSQWISGVIKRPADEAILAIARYCDGIEPLAPTGDTIPTDAEYEEIVSSLTGERILSERQARFVDALIERLGSAVQLSEADGKALNLLAGILGFRIRAG